MMRAISCKVQDTNPNRRSGELLVRPHLRPKPSALRLPQNPELEIALGWERLPERGSDGWWWWPTLGPPALEVEALPIWGEA
jgi:hypothetical protein